MRNLLISGLFVSVGLFLGRLVGFVREAYISSQFGASEQTDFIIIFLSAPDVLVNLLVGGALSMALIPEFKSLTPTKARLLYQEVFMILLVAFIVLAGVAACYSHQILKLFAPGFTNIVIKAYSRDFAITFIAIPLTVAAGVTTAYLHYMNKFLIASLGTLIFNLTVIVSLYLSSHFYENNILFVISIGVVFAAFIRWLSLSINSKTLFFGKNVLSSDLVSIDLIKRYAYCVLTGGVIFLIPIAARAIGSHIGSGELSLINYAIKLVEFPLGVLLTVFSIVFFPFFAEIFAKKNEKEFLNVFTRVLRIVLIISFSVFIPLNHFSSAIVNLIYDWGQLSSEQLYKISNYLQAVSLSLPFQAINSLLVAVLAARKDARNPLILSSFLAIIFITISYGFITKVSDVFNLMVFIYAIFSFLLLVILRLQHKISVFSQKIFFIDFIKLMVISILYYLLLARLSLTQVVWLDLLIATVTTIVFLLTCAYFFRDIRQIFLIRKGS